MKPKLKTNKVNKTNKPKKKFKWDVYNIILAVAGVLILIPVIIVAWVVISASMATGKVLDGNRFDGDLNPAITAEHITQIESKVEALEFIDEFTINLKSATLRVNVDLKDDVTAEQYTGVMDSVYAAVVEVLPVADYFTQLNGVQKQYDMEMSFYNALPKSLAEGQEFINYIMNKSSLMEAPTYQLVSKPKDAEYAQKLIDYYNSITEKEGE